MARHQDLRVECMECGLHFIVQTWEPTRHKAATLYCPECGQHRGQFLVSRHESAEPIVEIVSGDPERPEPPVT